MPSTKRCCGSWTWGVGGKPTLPRSTQSMWPTSPVGQLCTQGDDLDIAHPHRVPFFFERIRMEQGKALFPYSSTLYSTRRPMSIPSREKCKLGGLTFDSISRLVCYRRTNTMRKNSVRTGLSSSFCGSMPSSGLGTQQGPPSNTELDSSQYLLSNYYMAVTVLSDFHILIHLVLRANPFGRYLLFPCKK